MLVSEIYFLFLLQTNVNKDKVKAAIKAQQDQQIDNVKYLESSISWNDFQQLDAHVVFYLVKWSHFRRF